MSNAFNVEISMRETPADAQERAATAFIEPARAIGLRLTKRGSGELGYQPHVKFPLLVSLWHRLNGEQMTVKFEPGAEGGTRVTISGAVARGKHAMAADPERWSEAVGDSSPA